MILYFPKRKCKYFTFNFKILIKSLDLESLELTIKTQKKKTLKINYKELLEMKAIEEENKRFWITLHFSSYVKYIDVNCEPIEHSVVCVENLDICRFMVNHNPWSLKYIQNQTLDLCMMALKCANSWHTRLIIYEYIKPEIKKEMLEILLKNYGEKYDA